jgi:hypothetical protein
MARIDRLEIRIQTGSQGSDSEVKFQFNGHTLPFDNPSGGTGAGEVFEGAFDLMSVAHAVALNGPESGEWAIDKIAVTYHPSMGDPWDLCWGPVLLDATNAVNLWAEAPTPTFDV